MGALCGKVKRDVYGPSSVEYGFCGKVKRAVYGPSSVEYGALCGKVKRTVYCPSSVEYGGFVWQSEAYRVRSFLS